MARLEGSARKAVALVVLGSLALLAWKTLDPGRMLYLVWILLGGFALRVLLTGGRSEYDRHAVPVVQKDTVREDEEGLM